MLEALPSPVRIVSPKSPHRPPAPIPNTSILAKQYSHLIHTRTHARTHTRTHTRTHAHTHTRTHAHTHTHTHTGW